MSIVLPWARIADIAIRPRLFSGNQAGALGGADLPIPRLGDRFAVDVETTQLRQDAESRLLVAALMEASTADARIELRLPNRPAPIGGAIVVDGAGQAGSTLAIRGVPASAILMRGQFFSIVHAGVHFVHMVQADVRASGAGRAAVPIWPMLRFLTIDGEACAFDQPYIEGQLVGFDRGAGFQKSRTKPFAFSIQERR